MAMPSIDCVDRCGLSGLNCHSLAMAMWLRVDRYIKFMPERLNITNTYSVYSTDMCGCSSLVCVCIDGRKKKLTVPLGDE